MAGSLYNISTVLQFEGNLKKDDLSGLKNQRPFVCQPFRFLTLGKLLGYQYLKLQRITFINFENGPYLCITEETYFLDKISKINMEFFFI